MKRGLFFILFLILLDIYFYQGLKIIIAPLHPGIKVAIYASYAFFVIVTILSMLAYGWLRWGLRNDFIKYKLIPVWFIKYIAKFFSVAFLFINDTARSVKWFVYKIVYLFNHTAIDSTLMPRSAMLTKAGMLAATVPLVTLGYGILSGAHNYRVRRVRIKLPHLPTAFHGLKIGQLSDIHTGSFFNKKAVMRGVEMLLQEKPDVVFFTGDLVNDTADEVKEYIPIFSRLKAPLGIYSTLGNHDYGDYVPWPSIAAKQKNLQNLCKAHQLLGWRLLINEHIVLTEGTDKLAIIGIENWGLQFLQYGKLAQAYQGTSDIPVKLLLSHDPSHWDAEVRPKFSDIDITFAGHTHGFQFGIEIGSFKWSPVQYQYKQWAGLYQQGSQYLYVNRGFGYLGYPGRIGILPEITIVELEKG
jgi:predicted MPP superfamily phosphohydrolase